MEKPNISYRVMKTEEFEDSTFYRATCACGSDGHDMTLILEYDEDLPDMIDLVMYKKLAWCSYWGGTRWERFKKHISGSFRMLFTGYIEIEEAFIFQGEKHIDNFIAALEEGKERLKVKAKSREEKDV